MSIRRKSLHAVLAVLTWSAGHQLCAQALPAITVPHYYAYAAISGGQTGEYKDKAIGGMLGGYFQTNGLFGLEARAGGLRVKASYPFYFITVGPRASMTFPLVTAYAYAGLGVMRFEPSPQGNPPRYFAPLAPETNFGLQAAVGLDHSFGRITWRVADFTVSRAKGYGPNYPFQVSTGIRLRLP